MGRLERKIALITGASGGIGKATAVRFAEEGAEALALHYYSSKKEVTSISRRVERLGTKFILVRADVSNFDSVKSMVDDTIDAFGRIDILVACAGLPAKQEYWNTDPLNLPDEMIDAPWDVDLKGSYHCIRAVAPYMKKQKHGKIILLGSTPGVSGDPFGLGFTLAKTAVRALARSLAPVLGPTILINVVAPGSISTEANLKSITQRQKKELVRNVPLKRFGKPEEVADAAVFLASDESNYITGQTMIVDGGEIRL